MNNQRINKELIYDLTELKGNYNKKVQQLVQVYLKNVQQAKLEIKHLHHVLQTYNDTFNKIMNLLDIQHQVITPSHSLSQFQAFEQDLKGIYNKLVEFKNKEVNKDIQIVQKLIQVKVPVEVVREVEVERVVEVPVEKQIVVSKIVEVEKPIYIERIIEVEKIVEKQVIIPVTKEIQVQCQHYRNGLLLQYKLMLRRFFLLQKFTKLNQGQFLKLAYKKIEDLSESVESIDEDIDISSTNAILTIKKQGHTIVINTQTPNRQLWYSSTISGPQRFDLNQGQWTNTKNQQLQQIMKKDIKAILDL